MRTPRVHALRLPAGSFASIASVAVSAVVVGVVVVVVVVVVVHAPVQALTRCQHPAPSSMTIAAQRQGVNGNGSTPLFRDVGRRLARVVCERAPAEPGSQGERGAAQREAGSRA